jgi:uncharacterized protein (TIGR03437 family)
MKHSVCVCLALASAAIATAQPSIDHNGIVNAASFAKVALPNSSIAQGSFFSVFGTNLGPAKSPSLAFPLQPNLGGVTLTVVAGGQNFSAVPLFVGPGQINAVLPSDVPVGPATLTVNFNNGTSNSAPFQVVAHSFGIFTVAQSGNGPGVIQNAKYVQYTLGDAAQAGDAAIIWGTGLTGVNGQEFAGPLPGDHPEVPVEVYVGLTKADVSYRGRSGCCVGVDQIVFTVPSGITGCEIPVAVKIGDIVSNFVTMPIAEPGGPRVCSDANGPSQTTITEYLSKGFSGGSITLERDITTTPALPPPIGTGQPTTSTTDTGSANFAKIPPLDLTIAIDPFQVTTLGTCTIFTFVGESAVIPNNFTPTPLDAGKDISVKGPNGTMQLPEVSTGSYSAQLGGGSAGGFGVTRMGPHASTPLFLDPGAYTVTGPGGADVGKFTVNLNIAAPLTWTNETSITTVTRANGQVVTWTGGDPSSIVVITGSSIQLGSNPDGSDSLGGFFTCYAPDSAGQFDIPAVVLDSLPPSSIIPQVNIPAGSLALASQQSTTFTATGIDQGILTSTVTVSTSVAYQ